MITFQPLTLERWTDLETLFGTNGACGGCWCMWYRLPKAAYERGKGARNRARLRRLVEKGEPTGVIAYRDELPVGWCSVAPRSQYARLAASRTMHPADSRPSWTILCLFVASAHRRRGIALRLARAAAQWAMRQGAPGVEAFPIIPKRPDVPPPFASQGTLATYTRAGFVEVERRSPTRAVVRWPA